MNNFPTTITSAIHMPRTYTLDDVARIEASINSAPVPQRPLTKAEALSALVPTLKKAHSHGHSLSSLAQLCQQQGLQVSERTISRALTSARTGKPSRKKMSIGTSSTT